VIVSNLSASVQDGIFLAEGSRVALRAEPQPNAVFARWTGDTASTLDTLNLTMTRPFDLTATFVAIRQVVIGDAANAMLGISPLSADAAAYLDAAGNRNGRYDLGDFLAQVDRAR
jgi:Divergent InlB B-repeat domain